VAKTDPERAAAILHGCAQVAANCAVLLAPFLPRTAEKLAVAFGVTGRHWADAGPDLAVPGTPLGDLPILFPKIDDATVETARASLGTPADAAPAAADLPALKPEVTYDTFTALDLRVARVLACEKVPKADKLLQLTLDTGIDTRTVLSGIAEHFAPEDVVGRDVLLLANLAPRTIRGIESRGMVLLAETPDGSLRFVTPEEQPVAGSTVR
jgi:methionyl-tRNA synthetase